MDSVSVVLAPAASVAEDGLMLTLAVPAADADAPGNTTPNAATNAKLTSQTTDVRTLRGHARN
jgi:hypothetical protein